MSQNRGLKNRTAISTAINKELYERLKRYSAKTNIPLSKLFDMAVELLLNNVKE